MPFVIRWTSVIFWSRLNFESVVLYRLSVSNKALIKFCKKLYRNFTSSAIFFFSVGVWVYLFINKKSFLFVKELLLLGSTGCHVLLTYLMLPLDLDQEILYILMVPMVVFIDLKIQLPQKIKLTRKVQHKMKDLTTKEDKVNIEGTT
jgi:hypothetical protein